MREREVCDVSFLIISLELEATESAEVLPWTGLPADLAELLRKQVLLLSHEKWNFLSPLNRDQPPAFENYMIGQAKALLTLDPQLNQMRFALVPTKYVVDSESF